MVLELIKAKWHIWKWRWPTTKLKKNLEIVAANHSSKYVTISTSTSVCQGSFVCACDQKYFAESQNVDDESDPILVTKLTFGVVPNNTSALSQ